MNAPKILCKRCAKRGKDWNGDDPICAFAETGFKANWNCATLNAIRDICYEGNHPPVPGVDYQYCEDQKYATVKVDDIELTNGHALALWVTWYKNRGHTDECLILSDYHPPRRATEEDLEAIIQAYKKHLPTTP